MCIFAGLSTATLTGVALAAVAILLAFGVIVYWFYRKRAAKDRYFISTTVHVADGEVQSMDSMRVDTTGSGLSRSDTCQSLDMTTNDVYGLSSVDEAFSGEICYPNRGAARAYMDCVRWLETCKFSCLSISLRRTSASLQFFFELVHFQLSSQIQWMSTWHEKAWYLWSLNNYLTLIFLRDWVVS